MGIPTETSSSIATTMRCGAGPSPPSLRSNLPHSNRDAPRCCSKALFELRPHFSPTMTCRPMGERFVMVQSEQAPERIPERLNVVLHWLDELERRVQ